MSNSQVVIKVDQPISEGQEFYVYSEHLEKGQDVSIRRGVAGRIGNEIATGTVVANGSSDPKSKTPHPQNGTARAWQKYWKIKVGRIKP